MTAIAIAVTPKTTRAGTAHRRMVSPTSAMGVLHEKQCAQFVDGVDSGLGTGRFVRPAEAPPHEDHGYVMFGCPLDIVMAIADEHRPCRVDSGGVESPERLGDDV